jgi:hypothetical protein
LAPSAEGVTLLVDTDLRPQPGAALAMNVIATENDTDIDFRTGWATGCALSFVTSR